jgi:flagellar assembly factor FliW
MVVVASPTSEVRISLVTEAARINLVVWVAMAIRTNPAVAMAINPVAMAAKISPAMEEEEEEEEEGQTKTCQVVAVIRMQQTLRKTKMAMETPVIMVPTLR